MTTVKRPNSKTSGSKAAGSKVASPKPAATRAVAPSHEASKTPELAVAEAVDAAALPVPVPVAKAAAPAAGAFADMMALNTAAVVVAFAAGNAMLKGMGDMNRELLAYARSATDSGVEGTRSLMDARTVDEMVAVQRDMVQRSVTNLVAESTKIGQLAVKTVHAAGAPVAAHMTEAFKALGRPTAM